MTCAPYSVMEKACKTSGEHLNICRSICNEIRSSLDQVASLSGDRSHGKRFLRAWKALLSRSTTKPEDLHAILANLTGFSAREVMAYESVEERMRSMLYMFDELPLDLLYLDGTKYQPEREVADNWMPVWPCDRALISNSSMHFASDGYLLQLSPDDQLFGIGGGQICSTHFEVLAWSPILKGDATASSGWIEILEVFCHGVESSGGTWASEQGGKRHHLLLERTQDAKIGPRSIERGALLHTVRRDGDKHLLRYNCSVSIRRRFEEVEMGAKSHYLKTVDRSEDLYLQRGK